MYLSIINLNNINIYNEEFEEIILNEIETNTNTNKDLLNESNESEINRNSISKDKHK